MKYEWRKQDKELYSTKKDPKILSVPEQKFISIHGTGNPNGREFKQKVETLYPVAYGIKSAYKKYAQGKDLEFDDYTIFPLEGVWSLTSKGQQMDHLDKNEFSYDIMIRVPNFVPDDLITFAIQEVREKKDLPEIDNLEVKTYPATSAAQILHMGSFDSESESFQKMDRLVEEQNRERASKIHREIYLSDSRRVTQEKVKTILRYRIR
jgi:Uncharacterized conserved protein